MSNKYASLSNEIASVFFNMFRRNPTLLLKKAYDFIRENDNPSSPMFLQIEPTTRCNLNCEMCYVRKTGKNMDFGLFKKIIDQSKSAAHIHFQGLGEPLMNTDIFKMMEYVKKKGIETSITSNGLLLNKNALSKLKNAGNKFIYLSIDAPSKKLYEKIRRGGNFDMLERNLDEIRGNIDRVMCVVMKENINSIEGMVDFCVKFDIPMLYLHYENRASGVSESVRDVVINTELKARENGIKFKSLVPINAKKRLCKWPWIGSYITVDGDVLPCCNWPWFTDSKFGNIVENGGLKSVWNSNDYKKFRSEMRNNIPVFCKKCHRCKVSVL